MQLGEEGGEEGVAEGFIVWLPAAHLFLNCRRALYVQLNVTALRICTPIGLQDGK